MVLIVREAEFALVGMEGVIVHCDPDDDKAVVSEQVNVRAGCVPVTVMVAVPVCPGVT
jgi:hypothetical protein